MIALLVPSLDLLDDLLFLLSDRLLLDYLGKMRLELWRHDIVVVIELLEAFHDLLSE